MNERAKWAAETWLTLASRSTGLPIAIHTGDGAAALEHLEILTKTKCPLKNFIWVHAQNERNHDIHAQVARAGAWVEFDGINARSADFHLRCVEAMVRYAARFEYARTVEDVLARRCRLLFLDAKLAASLADDVSHILQEEIGRDGDPQAFKALAEQYTQLPV